MNINILNNMDFVKIFEQKLCEYTGFKYCVTVDCCTHGILLSLEVLNKLNFIHKETEILQIPNNTYISVPMTLKNNNWNFKFKNIQWKEFYYINNYVVDAAVFFKENIVKYFKENDLVCLSFQQKKRLSLGRGGAILLNNKNIYELLLRLRYDGRNSDITTKLESTISPDNILCGYHFYLEPDKAAQGILKINQINTLPAYKEYSYLDYFNISNLKAFK